MEIRNLIRSKSSTEKSCKEFGGSLVEYGLLVALVALIAIPSLSVLSDSLVVKFDRTALELATGGIPRLPPD